MKDVIKDDRTHRYSWNLAITRAAVCAVSVLSGTSVACAQWWRDELPQARAGSAGTAVHELGLFAGGWNDMLTSDLVDVYNGALDAWTTASLSAPRRWLAAATAGDVALFAGGLSDAFDPSDVVDLFDATQQSWSSAQLSVPRYYLAGAGWGDVALFAGGIATPPLTPSDAVDVYDAGAWSTSQLSQARWYCAAAAASGKILVGGGSTLGGPSDVVDVYDVASGTWSVEHLSVARHGLAAAAVGDLVLFAGGWDANGESSVVDIYEVSSGQWSTASLSEARGALAAATVGGRVLFAGGLVNVSFEVDLGTPTVDVFDAATGSWDTDVLTEARGSMGVATVAGRAFFAGGLLGCDPDCYLTGRVDGYRPTIGVSYCGPAVDNSTGEPARIEGYGSVDAAANDLTLAALDVPPQQFGYFLTSQTQGFVVMPGGSQGNLCLGGKIGRFAQQVRQAGDNGRLVIEVDLSALPLSPPVAVQPGETWSFQAWFRDMNPGATSNFTDGVSITFQ